MCVCVYMYIYMKHTLIKLSLHYAMNCYKT